MKIGSCENVVFTAPTSSPDSFLFPFLRVLQGEYRRLKWKHEEAASVPMLTEAGEGGPGSPTAEGQQDEELLAEARVLRQHKTRLETRMQILEDHNKQLESQLRRLRELLLQVQRGLLKNCPEVQCTELVAVTLFILIVSTTGCLQLLLSQRDVRVSGAAV